MPYVDGFLVPIRKKNVAAYRRLAQKSAKIWKKYGALEVRECIGDFDSKRMVYGGFKVLVGM